jgi:hypothetical protein
VTQKQLEECASAVISKLADDGKAGEWCKAEVEALWKLYMACNTALSHSRIQKFVDEVAK